MLSDYVISRIALTVSGLIAVIIVTRVARVAVYGTYAASISYATLLASFTDLGAASLLIREAGRDPERRHLREYLQVRVLLVALTTLVGAALVPVVFSRDSWSSGWLSLLLVVLCGPSVVGALGQVRGDMRWLRLGATVQATVSLAATIAVLAFGRPANANSLILATAAGAAVGSVVAFGGHRSDLAALASRLWQPAHLRSAVGSVFMIGLAASLIAIYYRIDSVMVLRIAGAREAGLYGAAYRLFDQARLLPTALLIPLAPLMARQLRAHGALNATWDERLRQLATEGGLGLALGSVALAHVSVLLLMGPRYREAGNLFVLLGASLGFVLVAYVVGSKAINARRENRFAGIAALGVLLNVGLNAVLIPRWGALGASIATLATELCTVLANIQLVSHISVGGYGRRVVATAILTTSVVLVDLRVIPAAGGLRVVWSVSLAGAAAVLLARAWRSVKQLDDPPEPVPPVARRSRFAGGEIV